MESLRYASTRTAHFAYFVSLLRRYTRRMRWDREKIEAEQNRALRGLLTHAAAHSPWHRERLQAVATDRMTAADIVTIPSMTKHDLMEHWDRIVTDPRIRLEASEAHLQGLTRDAYFQRTHHVIASGGSSGARGVFVVDWHGWAAAFAGFWRGIRLAQQTLGLGSPVSIAANSPTHATSALAQTFSPPWVSTQRLPVSLPLSEIVKGLNESAPSFLHCYPSFVPALCAEARAGRLGIEPRALWCTSEPLLPEARQAAQDTWGATVLNSWGASESNGGTFVCPMGDGFHISEDLNLIETVDEEGRAVPPGERSARIFVTNFSNRIQPLIRYEITDEFRVQDRPCACGSKYLKVDDVLGRADDIFRYSDGVVVHPHAFRTALGKERSVLEFQVRQTTHGADIAVVADSGFEFGDLERTLTESMARLGVEHPLVQVSREHSIPRSGAGKLKRFVPLP